MQRFLLLVTIALIGMLISCSQPSRHDLVQIDDGQPTDVPAGDTGPVAWSSDPAPPAHEAVTQQYTPPAAPAVGATTAYMAPAPQPAVGYVCDPGRGCTPGGAHAWATCAASCSSFGRTTYVCTAEKQCRGGGAHSLAVCASWPKSCRTRCCS